jgi:hypothetical protein
MSNIITSVRSELEKRLRELEPYVKEHSQIKDALERLASAVSPDGRSRPRAAVARAAKVAPARPMATAARRGRLRKGQPTRTEQFLEVVKANPGIRISDAAKQMGAAPNYVYRIRNDLLKAGTIKKQGQGFAVK